MSKVVKAQSTEEARFRNPPLWIHVSEAGKWLLSPREARKRAVIRLLDRMSASKIQGQTAPEKTGV
jgi:hypothetical protein